ncbi:MAG: hypothetical protein KAR05_02160 [Candidatus Omnitrophica bacterium]|nr:hypothetical protein [Candidatus Omnitrophota bacterium]
MKKNKIYIGFSLLLFVLFGLKDFLVLMSDQWPHLYSVVNVPRASWEEIYCYLPFANHFSLHNLLPAAPMTDPGLSQFTFFPALTLIIQGGIFKWICFSNIDLYLVVMHTVFPIMAFWLIFMVFRRYIDEAWSILLAFLGVSHFPNFSLISYAIQVLKMPAAAISRASLSPMELTRTPTPSFTFFFFILTFYLSTKDRKPTQKKLMLMSVMWGLNIYVYLYNFVAGVMFWFFYLIYLCYLKDKRFDLKRIFKLLAANFSLILIVLLPVLLKRFVFFSELDQDVSARMGLVSSQAGILVNAWGFAFSYILPIALVLIVIRLFCADYYELIYRFTPIFILILVEICVSNLHILLGSFFQPELFTIRIVVYFLRYLYFIPIIYFFSQPYKQLSRRSEWKRKVIGAIHMLFDKLFVRPRWVLVTIGVAAISLFVAASGLRFCRLHAAQVAPRMVTIEESLKTFEKYAEDKQSICVSDDIAVNLIFPALTKRPTLLVNAFSNNVASQEILNRILLYANIFSWDEDQFLRFIMPDEKFEHFNSDNEFKLTDDLFKKGFGFWLLNHRKEMSDAEIIQYKKEMQDAFKNFDFMSNIRRYRPEIVESAGRVNVNLPVNNYIRENNRVYYFLRYE